MPLVSPEIASLLKKTGFSGRAEDGGCTLSHAHIEPGPREKAISLFYLRSKLVYFLLFYFYFSAKIKKIKI
jgi:hypothetical protein